MNSDGPGSCLGPVSLPTQPERGCVVARAIPHLPVAKQRQLCAITRIIRATADVERVILFGSHARGDWVDDPVGGYISDFDVAVLVEAPVLAADDALWEDCQERAREVAGDTPVSLIAHTVDDVRQQLARGSSFFRDVMSEGIALYDAGRVSITVPELTPAQRLELRPDILLALLRARSRTLQELRAQPCARLTHHRGVRATPGRRDDLQGRAPGVHRLSAQAARPRRARPPVCPCCAGH